MCVKKIHGFTERRAGMNIRLLKARMIEHGKTSADMAAACGIAPSSWFNKIQGRSDFTVKEAISIKETLGLSNSEIGEIFFAN